MVIMNLDENSLYRKRKSSGSGLLSLALLIFFIRHVSSVIIMERSTGGFLKSRGFGPLKLVGNPENATIFTTTRIDSRNPTKLVIREMGGINAFDYVYDSDMLMLAPYHGGMTQTFNLVLNKEGVVQIVQDGQKFLQYKNSAGIFVGRPYSKDKTLGFFLYHNDGRSCYPPVYGDKSIFKLLQSFFNLSRFLGWNRRNDDGEYNKNKW